MNDDVGTSFCFWVATIIVNHLGCENQDQFLSAAQFIFK